MVAIVSKNLLKRERVAVASEGDLVIMNFGNTQIKMHYEAALQVSQWIRLRAKEAKRRAGDASRHWSAIGILEDANRTRG